MRKRYKKKRHSCGLCKPHKLGLDKRWANRALAELRIFETEIKNSTGAW